MHLISFARILLLLLLIKVSLGDNISFKSQLISSNLIKTYSINFVENEYKKYFCGNLSNCSNNINNVKKSASFGYFDLNTHPIINNSLKIKKILLNRLIYSTLDPNNKKVIVSGAVFIPQISKNEIKGIVLFFHPTFFDKKSVPSYGLNNGFDITLLASFVSNGYIVVAPDYIGLGYDRRNIAPYILYPKVNVLDSYRLLNHAYSFLLDKNYIKKTNNNLFVTGYSEGAGYALWFSKLFQQNKELHNDVKQKFNLKKVAPIAGAYNISEVTLNFLLSNINIFNKDKFEVNNSYTTSLLKPALLANALIAFSYYDYNKQYNKIFNPNFFNMKCSLQFKENCNFSNKRLKLVDAFNQESNGIIVQKIYNSASFKYYNNNFYSNQSNSILPLINKKILNNKQFLKKMQEANIDNWKSDIPTTFINLKSDSVVSNLNTKIAYNNMLLANSSNLKTLTIDNSLIKSNIHKFLPNIEMDHTNGFYYLYLVAVNIFNNEEN